MASFTSFTITQPFLGAPLQFQPALGSRELEQLIDAFVTGSASKKDKLSQVTIEFYNNATVDLNTGALVRRYDVTLSSLWQPFEESPTISQSSGFSPPIFTPSPASSATFADSGYGSISMTPPNRNRSRIAKKGKKDTKKTAEVRLPGFSIMTKDGVDVTSSAGRGTKTKEQREHAHLMRIMKACDDCKRKKVRCDPSHRRSQTDMSRSSTSETKTPSSSITPSPPAPSLIREATYESLPSFGTSAVDDFVLFPEDTAFWNPADMSLPQFDHGVDLSQFDFDISADQSLDFSSFEPSPSFQQPAYTPLTTAQFGLGQWASSYGGRSVTHSRPHHSASTQDSGQLDESSWYSSRVQLNDSPISPRTNVPMSSRLPHGSMDQSQLSQDSSASSTSPASSSSLERSVHDSISFANVSPHANQDLSAPAEVTNRKQRRSLKRGFSQQARHLINSVSSDVQHAPQAFYEPAFSDSPSEDSGKTMFTLSSSPYSMSRSLSGIERTYAEEARLLHNYQATPETSSSGCSGQTLSSASSYPMSKSISYIERTYAEVAHSLQAFPPSLAREQYRLRETIDLIEKSHSMPLGVAATTESIIDDLNAQLQALSANMIQTVQTSEAAHQRHEHLSESRQEYNRQCQITARRLVRSLCATIASLQAQNSTPSPTSNTAVLTSGHNLQLLVSPAERHNRNVQAIPSDESEQVLLGSGSGYENIYSQSSTQSSSNTRYDVILREDGAANRFSVAEPTYEDSCEPGSGHGVLAASRKSPRYCLLEKENAFDHRRQSPSIDSQLSVMLVRTDGSLRSSLLPCSIETSSWGAIPQSVTEQSDTFSVVAKDTLTGGFDMKYSVLAAVTLSASLVVLDILEVALLPLSLVPYVQGICTQWIDAGPLSAFAKLLLYCAAMQPPSALWKMMNGFRSFAPVAIATSLLQFPSKCSGIISSSSLSKRIQGKDKASLLEIFSSPVQLV